MIHSFKYPLNVYAWLLEREFGRVQHLHYGLFETPSQAFNLAQQRALDLVLAHLPVDGQILDVGCGVGSLLERLHGSGRKVLGLNPDPAQVAVVRERMGAQAPVCPCTLEAFEPQHGLYATLLFHESAQYIDGLDLLEAAQRLLSDMGCILILDEFTTQQDDGEYPRLPSLAHFLRWARRYGFEPDVQLDVSAQARPTLDWMLQSCQTYREQLCQELNLDTQMLEQLNRSNLNYRQAYASGKLGYFLLRLRRQHKPAYLPVRINTSRKAEQARALFETSFKQAMPPEQWQWKYGHGRGTAVGVLDANGQMVAHYGGVERALSLAGKIVPAFCGSDFMTDQAHVKLGRQGPAFLAAATFFEHELGYNQHYLVGFGFPNKRACALPARLGMYGATLTRMVEISLPALQTNPDWRFKIRPLDLNVKGCAQAVDDCHAALLRGLAGWKVPLRPYAWLHQRYAQHPLQPYLFFGLFCRFTGKLHALCVLRKHDDARCELLDFVGDLRLVTKGLTAAQRYAHALGASSLFLWASTDMLPQLAPGDAASVRDLELSIPHIIWTSGPAFESLQGHWWLMGGDTDFR